MSKHKKPKRNYSNMERYGSLNEPLPEVDPQVVVAMICAGCNKWTHFFVYVQDTYKWEAENRPTDAKHIFPYLEGDALSMMERKHHVKCYEQVMKQLEDLANG